MYNKDLYLSPKFAYYLSQIGQLDPLVVAYQTFREMQNYPFELKDKRIAIQSVFKGLCELYASRGFNKEDMKSSKEILEESKAIVENIWSKKEKDWEKRPEKESTKMVMEKIKKTKKGLTKTYVLDIKRAKGQKDFHIECQSENKEDAYNVMLKENPGLEKSAKSAVLKKIKELKE